MITEVIILCPIFMVEQQEQEEENPMKMKDMKAEALARKQLENEKR